MNKNIFFEKISEEIQEYAKVHAVKKNQKFYFETSLVEYTKQHSSNAIKYNEGYYSKIFNKETKVVLTASITSLFNFINKNYPKTPILFSTGFFKGKSVRVRIIKEEIDFTTVPTIEKILKNEPKGYNEKVQKLIVECAKKQLKLSQNDKTVIVYSTSENKSMGELEEESGELITFTKRFTYFWLKLDAKKGYYLDNLNPIKIND